MNSRTKFVFSQEEDFTTPYEVLTSKSRHFKQLKEPKKIIFDLLSTISKGALVLHESNGNKVYFGFKMSSNEIN